MKSGISKTLVCLVFIAVSFGCAAKPQMYYWGSYGDTLYEAKKKPGAETLAKHKEMLENIVEESKKRNLRIPPGVCAELGYLYAMQNDTKQAVHLFELEKQTYPEATILMDRLIQQSEKRTAGSSSEKESVEKLIEKEQGIGGDSND